MLRCFWYFSITLHLLIKILAGPFLLWIWADLMYPCLKQNVQLKPPVFWWETLLSSRLMKLFLTVPGKIREGSDKAHGFLALPFPVSFSSCTFMRDTSWLSSMLLCEITEYCYHWKQGRRSWSCGNPQHYQQPDNSPLTIFQRSFQMNFSPPPLTASVTSLVVWVHWKKFL